MRLLIKIILVFLIALVGLYAMGWYYASSKVHEIVDRAAKQLEAEGGQLSYESFEIRGFPVRFEAEMQGVMAIDGTGAAWVAPTRVQAKYRIFEPKTLRFELVGQHQFRDQTGLSSSVILDMAPLQATVGFDGILKEVHADITSAQIFISGKEALTLGEASLHIVPDDNAIDAKMNVGFDLLKIAGLPFEETAKNMQLNALIFAGLPKSNRPHHLRAWQQAGGQVQVEQMEMESLAMKLDGNGTIALDQNLSLTADMLLYAQNMEQAVQSLVSAGLIPAEWSNYMRFGMALFQRKARNGEGRELNLPLKLQGESLTVTNFTMPLPPRVASRLNFAR